MKLAVVSILSVSLFSCGGGGDAQDEDGFTVEVMGGEVIVEPIGGSEQPTGADISQVYSFSTSVATIVCLDGSTGTFPAQSNTFFVSTDSNDVVSAAPLFLSLGLLDGAAYTGELSFDNTFELTAAGAFVEAGTELISGITYTLSGEFTESGWFGTWSWVTNLDDISRSCALMSPFQGVLVQ